MPVVFDNLSSYYTQFVIKEITIEYEECIDFLPIIKKKYLVY